MQSKTKKKSAAKKPGMMAKTYEKVMPAMLRKKMSAKTAFDLTLFAASVFVIYKYGQNMNDYISEFVPSEASMR